MKFCSQPLKSTTESLKCEELSHQLPWVVRRQLAAAQPLGPSRLAAPWPLAVAYRREAACRQAAGCCLEAGAGQCRAAAGPAVSAPRREACQGAAARLGACPAAAACRPGVAGPGAAASCRAGAANRHPGWAAACGAEAREACPRAEGPLAGAWAWAA